MMLRYLNRDNIQSDAVSQLKAAEIKLYEVKKEHIEKIEYINKMKNTVLNLGFSNSKSQTNDTAKKLLVCLPPPNLYREQ